MDLENISLGSLDNPPRWASSWCYFYLLAAGILAFFALLSLLMLIFAFSAINKRGLTGKVLFYTFAFIIQAIGSLVFFWMCRNSLKRK
jgi:hypothetical protein